MGGVVSVSIKLKGRSISKGYAEGEALVCHHAIGFNFGVDVETGTIIEHNHELQNQSFKDKILVFPQGKGSTGGSYVVYQVAKYQTGPKAIINVTTETIIAVGAIMGGIPVIDQLDSNPLEVIASGDYVKVDAVNGTVEVFKKGDLSYAVN
jgi:predicted aconitase with swiveling domain